MPNDAPLPKRTLQTIARGQRSIIHLLLFGFAIWFAAGYVYTTSRDESLRIMAAGVAIALIVAQLVLATRLAFTIVPDFAGLFCLLAMVPGVNLLSLLVLNQKATKILKANGIGVGFLGVDMDDFKELSYKPDECAGCGKPAAETELECPKCKVRFCDACAVRTQTSAGVVESFAVSCPRCRTALVEVPTRAAGGEEPAADDFGEEVD